MRTRPLFLAVTLILAMPARAQPSPRFHAGGFADAIFAHPIGSDSRTHFDTGEVDFYGTYRLSERWSFLGEELVQHLADDGDIDVPAKSFEVDLERLYAAYDRSDRLRVEIGQLHTGVVDWNQREHRSRFLQTPIDVPSIARGEEQGGAWPLHFSGVWVSGRARGPMGFTYGAGVGSSRGRSRDEVQPFFDRVHHPAGLISAAVAPDVISGLEVGAAAYSGLIPAEDGRMRERDATLSSAFVRGPLELRGEWSEMVHKRVADDRRFVTKGWYALASWRWRTFRPYVLLDHVNIASGESYLSELHDQNARAAGVRWDITPRLAIKTDVRSQLNATGRRDRAIRAQLAVSF